MRGRDFHQMWLDNLLDNIFDNIFNYLLDDLPIIICIPFASIQVFTMRTTSLYWLALTSVSCFQCISAAPIPSDGSSISNLPFDQNMLAKRFFAKGEIEGLMLEALREDPDLQLADTNNSLELYLYVEALRKQVKEELGAEGSKIELV